MLNATIKAELLTRDENQPLANYEVIEYDVESIEITELPHENTTSYREAYVAEFERRENAFYAPKNNWSINEAVKYLTFLVNELEVTADNINGNNDEIESIRKTLNVLIMQTVDKLTEFYDENELEQGYIEFDLDRDIDNGKIKL